MRHLDGKTYQDPGQRSAAGLPPYPTDWTAALQIHDHDAVISSAEDVPDAQKTKKDVRAHKKSASGLVAVRDAVCWDSLAAGCTAPKGACTRLHPMHAGTPVCGRHATSLLGLWGRRQRPPCMGGCGKAHPSLGELKAALRAALPAGSRLHEHVQPPPPCLGRAESARNNGSGASAGGCDNGVGTGIHSLYVAPSDFEPAAINEALAAQAPMPLRVAIDVGFDEIMSEGERKSLATQCGLMHGIASQADVRQHVALAICCGTPSLKKNGAHAGAAATPPCIAVFAECLRRCIPVSQPRNSAAPKLAAREDISSRGSDSTAGDGNGCEGNGCEGNGGGGNGGGGNGGGGNGGGGDGESSYALLRAAGLDSWRPLAWQSDDGQLLSLLTIPGADARDLVYLSPDAPNVLTELRPSEAYVIGGLVDRHKKRNASYDRARALGLRCARLPLVENLPAEMRGRSNALDALNLNSAFKLLVEWSKCRDWGNAIATAFDGSQRHCGKTQPAGMIHAHGYWDGPFAASQHQYDAKLSEALLAFFREEKARTVVDLGCGMGNYVRHFRKCGLSASGFDGNPSTPQLSKGACSVLDLSVIADVNEPYDWVMSLEVGEHLPKAYEDAFIENLHRHNTRGMVLSWALKGQGGTGHVNEQNNDYVKAKISAMGYVNDVETEQRLRMASRFSYFKKTIMVFRRR